MSSYAEAGVGQRNPIQNLGFWILVFYVFGIFSAFIDLIRFLHVLRPMVLTGFVGLCIVLLTGRVAGLVQEKVGVFLLLFTGWMICCIPASIWPGGAFNTFINDWQKAALTFFLAGGLVWDHTQCRKVLHALGYAAVLLSLLALKANGMVVGRLILANTRYENPNDLAMILLTALPCLGYMVVRSDNKLRKLVAAGGFIPVLLAISKTGSRAALIGAAVMVFIVFLQATLTSKVKLLAVTSIAVLMLAIVLPNDIRQRFVTIFGDDEAAAQDESAIESSESRKMLLLDSITITGRNPLFGVGPGQFQVAQYELAKERGEIYGNWHVTHNTYTQVSSECGIPALLFFMGAIVSAFRSLRRTTRMPGTGPVWDNIRMMANTLRISVWSFCSIGFFASVAYLPFLPILCGLTVGLEYVARNLLAEETKVATPPLGRTGVAMLRPPSLSRA